MIFVEHTFLICCGWTRQHWRRARRVVDGWFLGRKRTRMWRRNLIKWPSAWDPCDGALLSLWEEQLWMAVIWKDWVLRPLLDLHFYENLRTLKTMRIRKKKKQEEKQKTKETQDRRQRKKQNKGIRRDDSPQMTRQRTSQHHMAQDESTSHDSTTDHKYHIHLFKMSCRTPAFSELEVPFLEEVLQDMRFWELVGARKTHLHPCLGSVW